MNAGTERVMSRDYAPEDRAACLEIFDSLTPRHFRSGERSEFEAFLDSVAGSPKFDYQVIEDEDGRILAGGGTWVEPAKGVASLCWDMVRPDCQGQGIGRFLLLARLGRLADRTGITHVVASAGRSASGFFLRQGFSIYHVQQDYFGPGEDLVDMQLALASEE